jgi:hypothetical protein
VVRKDVSPECVLFPAPQARSMKRARDVRDQLVGLMERVEIDMVSHADDHEGVKKARPDTPRFRGFTVQQKLWRPAMCAHCTDAISLGRLQADVCTLVLLPRAAGMRLITLSAGADGGLLLQCRQAAAVRQLPHHQEQADGAHAPAERLVRGAPRADNLSQCAPAL